MKSKLSDINNSGLAKYKYSFNQKIYDLNLSSSVDSKHSLPFSNKINHTLPDKIKSGINLSLDKIKSSSIEDSSTIVTRTPKVAKNKDYFKLPTLIKKDTNPQEPNKIDIIRTPKPYYQARVMKAFNNKENTYLSNLAKQHFIQSIEAIRIGKTIKINPPQKQIKLSKKQPKFKTIYLDMDETLIHCDETSNSYTVKLNFPIQGGGTIAAGIRVRPYCQQFLKQLSTFAEIIIFTASSASYADVVLDYIDPNKKYISHRLYRQHCTLQRQFFTKDLRVVNRRLQDCLLVDNSAFSFMLQPDNGVPILPFYHLAKDKELISLIQFLKKAVEYPDMRNIVRQSFFWSKYLSGDTDPRKVFMKHFNEND